ncbi:dihydrodipicolinate synthase family protein [Pectobacterium carotovorum]|uniref:dihydrodipicolinate synthase family protein n=1 Tax=Pectobacterium carotovorum TaxID=554 RepID=UPI001F10EEE6|nr:dihydrodipicolinate synthase family protein [Pectobacterium carotovorum]MCH4994725.1 dihydrodipicolinate synthase family protein [Pectobacterium carotovorum]
MSKNITGVLTAIVTPFDNQGEFNPAAMRLQVQRQMRYGNGIFCNGTNGEFFVLHTDEKVAVTETCVDEVAGKVPVVGHIGEISTRETIKLGKRIAALGVDAVSVITPYFIPLKQEELIAHYTAVADALTVPVFLYNIPARTGNTLAPETVRTLADHPNIIGIKDSAGSYESLSSYVQAVKGVQGFNVLNGPDSLIHQGFVDGCSACISGLANVAPEPISQIWHRFNAGDIEGSRQAQEQVTELRKTLYAIAFSPAVVKKALAIMGEDVGVSRYPIQFSAQDEDNIRNILSQFSQ